MLIGNPSHGGHLENLFFTSSPKPKSQLTLNLVGSNEVTYSFKWLKLFRLEIQHGCHGGNLENLFFTSSPELKGLLTLS